MNSGTNKNNRNKFKSAEISKAIIKDKQAYKKNIVPLGKFHKKIEALNQISSKQKVANVESQMNKLVQLLPDILLNEVYY